MKPKRLLVRSTTSGAIAPKPTRQFRRKRASSAARPRSAIVSDALGAAVRDPSRVRYTAPGIAFRRVLMKASGPSQT